MEELILHYSVEVVSNFIFFMYGMFIHLEGNAVVLRYPNIIKRIQYYFCGG